MIGAEFTTSLKALDGGLVKSRVLLADTEQVPAVVRFRRFLERSLHSLLRFDVGAMVHVDQSRFKRHQGVSREYLSFVKAVSIPRSRRR